MRSLIDRDDQIVFGEDVDIAQPAFDAIVSSFSCAARKKRVFFRLWTEQRSYLRDIRIVVFAFRRQTGVEKRIEQISPFAIFFGEFLVIEVSRTIDHLNMHQRPSYCR